MLHSCHMAGPGQRHPVHDFPIASALPAQTPLKHPPPMCQHEGPPRAGAGSTGVALKGLWGLTPWKWCRSGGGCDKLYPRCAEQTPGAERVHSAKLGVTQAEGEGTRYSRTPHPGGVPVPWALGLVLLKALWRRGGGGEGEGREGGGGGRLGLFPAPLQGGLWNTGARRWDSSR